MSLLLDTHVLLEILQATTRGTKSRYELHFRETAPDLYASVASLWEIAIKSRLGKLELALPVDKLALYFESIDVVILPVQVGHAAVDIHPEPTTRDPFDRLLLSVCKVERLELITEDGALVDHPLAWKP